MARYSLDLLPIYSLAHDRHQHPAITACYAGDTDTTPSPPAPRLVSNIVQPTPSWKSLRKHHMRFAWLLGAP